MQDEITVCGFDALVEHAAMVASGNSAGVQRVDVLARAGAYIRLPPQVIDTAHLDADQHDHVRAMMANTVQSFGPVRSVLLKDAAVTGQGAVVTRDGRLIRDSVLEFLAGGNTPDGFTQNGEALRLNATSTRRIAVPSLLLKRPWFRNYGHWLVDSASMLAMASRLPILPGWQVVVGQQGVPKMREMVLQTLAIVAPGVPVAEHPDDETWVFDQLCYPTPLHVPPLFKHPEGLASLRALVLREHLHPAGPPRRLFVSRGNHPSRRLDNEAELAAIAQASGYEVVQPEALDLPGQARLFHAAECIVGVKGAALTNLFFCNAGASALLLSPGDFPDPFFWDVANHAGVTYAEIFGQLTGRDRPRSFNSFVIDPVRFSDLLPL